MYNIFRIITVSLCFHRFLADLSTDLYDCRKTNTMKDEPYCNSIEYREEMVRRLEALKQNKIQQPANGPIQDVNDLKYHQIFQDFIVPSRSFKGRFGDFSDIEHCKEDAFKTSKHHITGDVSLRGCSDRSSFILPSIVRNNYLFRLNSNNDLGGVDLVDYATQWPALVPLSVGIPTNVARCQMSMHQFVGNLHDSKIRVRLFSDSAYSEFEPIVDINGTLDIPLHFTLFNKTGFPKLSEPDKRRHSLPKFLEATLLRGEYLFIPNSMLSSFVVEEGGSGELLKFCFVDASNINAVRESFALSALISPRDKYIFKMLVSGIDMKMDMMPSRSTLSAISAGGNLNSNVNESHIAGQQHQQPTRAVNSRRRGSEQATVTNREWLETKLWDNLVKSLTLCPPIYLSVSDVGRTNLTLRWQTSYVHDIKDAARFGFNVSVCRLTQADDPRSNDSCEVVTFDYQPLSLLTSALDADATTREGVEITAHSAPIVGLQSGSSYYFRVTMFLGDAVTNPSPWSAPVSTLSLTVPSSIPDIDQLKELYGSAALGTTDTLGKKKRKKKLTLPNNRNNSIETKVVSSTEVVIDFHNPFDDGGSELIGFSVYGRYVQAARFNLPVHWQLQTYSPLPTEPGSTQKLLVTNLFGGTAYEFRVAAVNMIGEGPLSGVSNPVTTADYAQHGVVVVKVSNFSYPVFTRISTGQDRVSIVGFDSQQVIQDIVYIRSWRCHWSPPVDVIGILVQTNPLLADSDILNSHELRGNIALVSRGTVPVVYKIRRVQLAGAIGVIVVDNGDCLDFDQMCFPGSDHKFGDGFASHDAEDLWKDTRIPVTFVLLPDLDKYLNYLQQRTGNSFNILEAHTQSAGLSDEL